MNETSVYNWRVIIRVRRLYLIQQVYFLLIHFRLLFVLTNVLDTNSYQLILMHQSSLVI